MRERVYETNIISQFIDRYRKIEHSRTFYNEANVPEQLNYEMVPEKTLNKKVKQLLCRQMLCISNFDV